MAFYQPQAYSSPSDQSSSLAIEHFSETSSNISSQASVISVDANTNYLDTTMAEAEDVAEDVSAVMSQVLSRMARIVEHLREKGENEAANTIAKHTVSSVNIFNETIAPWDISATVMRSSRPSREPHTQHQSTSQLSAASSPPAPQSSAIPISWAAVAAVAPAAGNKLIKYTPSDAVKLKINQVIPTPITNNVDLDKRVVWIRGWSASKSFSEITDRIGQGPIYSMAYSEADTAVCVVFQHASSARELCSDDQLYVKNNGHSRFGPGCDVVEGLPYADNEDLQRMLPPANERRRLTFARSQLFTHGLNEDRFRRDIYSIVGEANVELVWLFNSGNATVVLSAVPLARLVRREFLRIARNHGSPYQGVIISFSHDPCERPMTLVTQMTTGRQRTSGTYGYNSVVPAGIVSKSGPASRRGGSINEIDGWQTVSRKR